MKNYILVLVVIFSTITAFAQKPKVKNDPTHDDKPIHFGFSLGLNYMNYSVYQSEFAQTGPYYVGLKTLQPGINIQAITNLRLSKSWDLRCLPGISFGERHLTFMQINGAADGTDSVLYDEQDYRMSSAFIEIPLSLKYKAHRMNNFRPYLIGGVNFRYDLSVKKEYDYKEQLIMVKPFDIYLEFGTGFDFYLAYFKLGIELKYGIGMFNMFSPTNRAGEPPTEDALYTNMIDKLKSQMFVIAFHFE